MTPRGVAGRQVPALRQGHGRLRGGAVRHVPPLQAGARRVPGRSSARGMGSRGAATRVQPSAAARAAALSCQGLGFESCFSAAARACEACFCCKERAAALRRGSARAGGAPTCSLLLAKSARGEALPCLHPVCSRPQRRTPKGMACVQTEWAKALFVNRSCFPRRTKNAGKTAASNRTRRSALTAALPLARWWRSVH